MRQIKRKKEEQRFSFCARRSFAFSLNLLNSLSFIHLQHNKQGHEELMKLLLEAAPEAASVRDARKGRTPEEALRERRREEEGRRGGGAG